MTDHLQFDREAYMAKRPQEIEESATRLIERFGSYYYSFLSRADFDEFVRSEVLPLYRRDPKHSISFLDNDHWHEKHPFNFPGPFYTGISDTCGTGDFEAEENVLYDGNSREYIFKQPSDYLELVGVLDAAAVEVLDSYSCNGNKYWTYEKCREWWRSKPDILMQLKDPEIIKANGPDRVQLYIDYLNRSAERDLRRYCYFLENGHYPQGEERLPDL